MLDQFEGICTEIEDAFNNMVLIGREDEADDGLDVILDDMEEKEEEEEEEEGIDLVEGNEEEKEEETETDEMKRLVHAMHRLEVYCKELPILGFSSASYDINLIRSHLFKVLSEFGEATMFTVKKSSKYQCIKTNHFKFLDVLLEFLAPGYNLSSFFKAFNASEQKSWFTI